MRVASDSAGSDIVRPGESCRQSQYVSTRSFCSESCCTSILQPVFSTLFFSLFFSLFYFSAFLFFLFFNFVHRQLHVFHVWWCRRGLNVVYTKAAAYSCSFNLILSFCFHTLFFSFLFPPSFFQFVQRRFRVFHLWWCWRGLNLVYTEAGAYSFATHILFLLLVCSAAVSRVSRLVVLMGFELSRHQSRSLCN